MTIAFTSTSRNPFPNSLTPGEIKRIRSGDKEAEDLEVLVGWRRRDSIRMSMGRGGGIDMAWCMMRRS